MDNLIKDIYKSAEEKRLCMCLVQKDVRKFTDNLVRQTRPCLPEERIEDTVNTLMREGCEEFKKERDTGRMNQIRRSFRNIVYGSLSRKCGCTRGNLNCNCEVTCRDAYKALDILQPFGRVVATNRSFRLKLKHLDQEKYGHLDTEVPHKKMKLNGSSEKVELKSSVTRRVRRSTVTTSSRRATQNKEVLEIREETTNATKELPLSDEVTLPEPTTNKETVLEEPAKNEHEPSHVDQRKEKRIKSKAKHSKSKCNLCQKQTKKVEKVSHCKRHCPKCIKKRTRRNSFDCDHCNAKDNFVVIKESYRVISSTKFIVDEVGEDGLQAQLKNLYLNTDDYYQDEWDFEISLNGRKRKMRPSTTVQLLEDIGNKHVRQLKDDLSGLQDHFNAIKAKHAV